MVCASNELDQRLYDLARECLLLAEPLSGPERKALEPLWVGIAAIGPLKAHFASVSTN